MKYAGQRIKKSNASSTTLFVTDEQGHLLGEYGGTNTLIAETIWLGDIPVASIRTNDSGTGVGIFYLHTDHLNAPQKMTRATDNQVVWRWDHDPYGNGVPNEDPDGNGLTVKLNLRYPGQYLDQETGLYYNYFRYYDPPSGRYLESDPIGLSGGSFSTYSYGNNNPISKIDPTGESAAAAGEVVIGGGIIVAGCAVNQSCRDAAQEIAKTLADQMGKPNCPDEECKRLNDVVQNAKTKVGALGACRSGMSRYELSIRYQAWLELAVARAKRDIKCWGGGDEGHQTAQAGAWAQVGKCGTLLGANSIGSYFQ